MGHVFKLASILASGPLEEKVSALNAAALLVSSLLLLPLPHLLLLLPVLSIAAIFINSTGPQGLVTHFPL